MIPRTLSAGTGVELAYIDSGAPSNPNYSTIIAIHGAYFTNLIYEKLLNAAHSKGVRVIALNRRSFPGSTSFSPEEMNLVTNNGSATDKDAFMRARGCELGIFISNLIQEHNLPPVSVDGKSGGVILLGWSLGAFLPLAMISNARHLPSDVRKRLDSNIRSLLLNDPAGLGLPLPKQSWAPLLDTSLPLEARTWLTVQWFTAYFDHGDLTKRDLNSLSWWIPSTKRIPSMFNIPTDMLNKIVDMGPGAHSELPFVINFSLNGSQFNDSYRQALYGSEALKEFPRLKVTVICGDESVASSAHALWAIEDDEKEAGRPRGIQYKFVKGANHFWHWDNPQECLDDLLSSA